MTSEKSGGRGVFIGNIPYGLTEEQIIQICNTVGQVISFRLVHDADTHRPKGFGFAEFVDADAAASAVRNLDKYQIQGRELRVDYSHVGNKDNATNNQNTLAPGTDLANNPAFNHALNQANGLPPPPAQQGGQQPTNPLLPPLPPGAEIPPGLNCPDAISKTLATLPAPQLLDILSQMKNLVTSDPARAAELLRQAPQLSYAIFQALLLMGLVDSGLIASVVESSAGAGGAPQPGGGQQNLPNRPPAQQQPQYGAPAPPPQQPPQMQIPPGQEELIRQLLAMPQSEIDRLSPNERQQIMALRSQYGGMM